MAIRYLPLELKHPPTPKIRHLALLAGLEAAVRATLVSVWPIYLYRLLGSAQSVSLAYLYAGVVALFTGLMVPWLSAYIPRRWIYTTGCLLYVVGGTCASLGTELGAYLALLISTMGTAAVFACFNAYVLDYVARENLGRSQSVQMAFAAAPWTLGPLVGPPLYNYLGGAIFFISSAFALILLTTFWVLRLGNGKQIQKARGPAINPLAFLGRFLRQPRLIAGYIFAVTRACGWWVYMIYLPIFCIDAGLGDNVASIAFSLANALLFIAPIINRQARKAGVRKSVRFGFMSCGLMMLGAGLLGYFPWVSVALMFLSALFLITLDVVSGLPFMMSVKPAERTEMSAVYASFRDVSGILTPGVAWLVLFVLPVHGVFVAAGLGMFAAWGIAGTLHPRLGVARPSRGGQEPAPRREAAE